MTRFMFGRPEAHDLYGIDPSRLVGSVETEKEYMSFWRTTKLGEWIDGFVVEKVSWLLDSLVTSDLSFQIYKYSKECEHGFCLGPTGPYRMKSGNVLMPDFSYTHVDKVTKPLPDIADWCADLCVDVISPENGEREMAFRRNEFFSSGCQLYWEIDPRKRLAKVYAEPGSSCQTLKMGDTLTGGTVLKDLALPFSVLFDQLDTYWPQSA